MNHLTFSVKENLHQGQFRCSATTFVETTVVHRVWYEVVLMKSLKNCAGSAISNYTASAKHSLLCATHAPSTVSLYGENPPTIFSTQPQFAFV